MPFLGQIEPIFFFVGTIVVLIIALAIFYSPYLGLLVMIFLIPFETILVLGKSFTVVKAIGMLTFISFVFHCILNREKIAIEFKILIPLICFLFWTIWNVNAAYNRLFTLTQLVLFFILTCSLCSKSNKRIDLVIYALTFACLITIPLASSAYISELEYGTRASLGEQNPNQYACLLSVNILLLLFFKTRLNKYQATILYIVAVPFIYGLITSGSRGAAFALCLTLAVYFVGMTKKYRTFAQVALIVFIVYSIIEVGPRTGLVKEHSIERIETIKSIQDTTMRRRFEIWNIGYEIFLDNFFVGVGYGNFPKIYAKYVGLLHDYGADPHNTYLSILVETGVIGFILAISFPVIVLYRPK